jgi:hypothetical protein
MRREILAKEGMRLTGKRSMMLIRFVALSSVAMSQVQSSGYFTESEKSRIQSFWNGNGRFTVTAPKELRNKGPWQVRLTPEGSTWLYTFNSARGIGKGAVAKANLPRWEVQHEWEQWVNARIAFDWAQAGRAAAEANSRFMGRDMAGPDTSASDPGAAPSSLRTFAGDPPRFAAAVAPNQYVIHFEDGSQVKMMDNPSLRANFPSYRFAQGVMSSGTPVKSLPSGDLDALFSQAGIDSSTQKVMKAVSCLEGGFDSINTYDTGYVSVGLIQFACLSKGAGSLGRVLLREKQENPAAFERDFRHYGVDVTPGGALVALDLDTALVYEGAAAARRIINDKRLAAVFQHAGQRSTPFQVAQLKIAKDQYYPSEDVLTINAAGGQTITARVGDFIRSEAGLATVMDRKVNTGRLDPLPAVLSHVATECNCRSAEELATHEREVIAALRFRKDYTLDPELSQPSDVAIAPRVTPLTSRHGSRGGRGYRRRT